MQVMSEKIDNKKKGKKFADDIFNFLTLILLFIIFIVEILHPILFINRSSFFENTQKFNLAVEFTRITFPFLLFVSLSSFFQAS